MNTLVENANAAAESWLAWIVPASLDCLVLVAILALVWLAIRRRAAPQVGYCLFLLVPLKLLVPIDVQVPAAIARWTPTALTSAWLDSDSVPRSSAVQPQPTRDLLVNNEPAPSQSTVTAKDPSAIQLTETVALPAPTNGAESTPRQPTIAAAPTRPIVQPSAAAIALAAWLAVVLLLAWRFVRAQWQFRARFRSFPPFDADQLGIDFGELQRHLGLKRQVRIVQSEEISAPAVWGVWRPAIILPRATVTSLSRAQLRWVLLHELAHIRRGDLLVVLLQRCVAILHFFNPGVWVANRMMDRLREYACDDLALARSGISAVESGQAFLEVLKHASRRHQRLAGALGIFGLGSRSFCTLRLRRLLDVERPVRVRLGAWSLAALVLAAIVALPHLRAADPVAESASAENSKTSDDPAPPNTGVPAEAAIEPLADGDAFELTVVGPDGQPVADAAVELRTNPKPDVRQLRQGKFRRLANYGIVFSTDAEGKLVVGFPRVPKSLDVNITTPGYGPYWAAWSSDEHKQPVPRRFTAELDSAWSIGSVLVDPAGQPLAGVKVSPRMSFKKHPGDRSQLGVGTELKTDRNGQWRFDSVPDSLSEIMVEFDHPAFRPLRATLTRSNFEALPGEPPLARTELDPGMTVTGTITDETGQPIAGALVRTKFLNDIREARTGADGVYKLVGCEPRTAKLVASAKGRATDMQELRLDPQMDPVDFQLKPGGKVRVRVLDENGQPIARARIFFQRWRGPFSYFEFGHVSQYANEEGVWEWNEAPLDEFSADICRNDGMSLALQPLVARDEEYVFRLPPALVISGKVIDAVTRQPIPSFQVLPGIHSSETHISWVENDRFTASGGEYQLRRTHAYPAHLVRIEASGYLPAVSRDIQNNEGQITIDFALKKGQDVAAIVRRPDGQPAVGAKIALGTAGSQIVLQNGEIDSGSTYATCTETDAGGRFRFAPQSQPFQLVIAHPTGYAHIKATPESSPSTIELTAWASVEGKFQVGKQQPSGVPITIGTESLHSYGRDVPNIFVHYDLTTGEGGAFRFERVIAGRARIGRRIMMTIDDGAAEATSSISPVAELKPGQTFRMDLGGSGRPVVGVLQPPQQVQEPINWNFALVEVDSFFQAPLDPETLVPEELQANTVKRAEWLAKWKQSADGQAWTALKAAYDADQPRGENQPHFRASVDRTGKFRIDDMPEGEYTLSVWFSDPRKRGGRLTDYRFSVPPADPGEAQPVELGELRLE